VFRVGGYQLGRLPLRGLRLLGGEPLAPRDAALYDGLFATLADAFPTCSVLCLDRVERGGFLWRFLHTAPALADRYAVHLPDGVRRYYAMPLPATYGDYLSGLRAKRRYNLKRQVRLLRGRCPRGLEVLRIDSAGQVRAFLDAAWAIAEHAGGLGRAYRAEGHGAAWRGRCLDLAGRGLLRSYLLRCGGRDVACLVGCQYEGTYVVETTLYHRGFARSSPGTVLLHLALEDLLGHRPVRLIDFGPGDLHYRHAGRHVCREGGPVFLLRNTLGNRVRQAAHAGFQRAVRGLKRSLAALGLVRDTDPSKRPSP
jgi:hypothetical protein